MIDPEQITLANLHTGSGGSKVVRRHRVHEGDEGPRREDRRAAGRARDARAESQGMVGAHLDLERHGGRWSGEGHVTAQKLDDPEPAGDRCRCDARDQRPARDRRDDRDRRGRRDLARRRRRRARTTSPMSTRGSGSIATRSTSSASASRSSISSKLGKPKLDRRRSTASSMSPHRCQRRYSTSPASRAMPARVAVISRSKPAANSTKIDARHRGAGRRHRCRSGRRDDRAAGASVRSGGVASSSASAC